MNYLQLYKTLKMKKHRQLYYGFVIERCYRSAIRPMTRYRIWYRELSLGLFDNIENARHYIDNLRGNIITL